VADSTPEIDFVEIIEPVLDNTAFLMALAGGAVIGFIAYYAVMEYLKTHPRTAGMQPETVETINEATEDAHAGQVVDVPAWASGQGQ